MLTNELKAASRRERQKTFGGLRRDSGVTRHYGVTVTMGFAFLAKAVDYSVPYIVQ